MGFIVHKLHKKSDYTEKPIKNWNKIDYWLYKFDDKMGMINIPNIMHSFELLDGYDWAYKTDDVIYIRKREIENNKKLQKVIRSYGGYLIKKYEAGKEKESPVTEIREIIRLIVKEEIYKAILYRSKLKE